VCAPVLSRHVTALTEKYRWGQRPMSRGVPWLNWIVLTIIGLTVLLKVVAQIAPVAQQHAETQNLPTGAANWISANHPAGKLFNSYNWGGYLMWRLGAEYPVYVDGRTDVYDNAFLQEYLKIVTGQLNAPAVFDERGIKVVMVEPESPLGPQLLKSGRWQAAYRDDMAVVYVRARG